MSKIVDLTSADRVGKRYLIEFMTEVHDLSSDDATKAVNGVLEAITKALRSGVNVSLSNIGTFRRETAAARRARNPQTGDTVEVDAQEVVRWTSSPTLLGVLNGRTQRDSLAVKAPKGSL